MTLRRALTSRSALLIAMAFIAFAPSAIAASNRVTEGSVQISVGKPAAVTLDLGRGLDVRAGLTVKAGRTLGGAPRGLVVERLWVQKGGKSLEVPLSSYVDIYDPHTLVVSARAKSIEIEIYCSDGADGYRVALKLDDQGVVSRTLFVIGDHVAETTIYHRVVID